MKCKFLTPSGNPSKLFDDTYKSMGLNSAVKVFNKVNSPTFVDWYGTGTKVDGEPVITNGVFTNGEGDVMSAHDVQTFQDSKIENKVNFVKDKFTNAGIDIEVIPDSTIAEEGYVVNANGIKLYLNESKIKSDTVFHEFGHIYIDVIGESNPLIQKGIEELKGTSLWNTIAKAYPKLNELQLGKEVLSTAIGIEAAKQYDVFASAYDTGRSFSDKVLFYIKRIIRQVADKLGVKRSVASRLAYELTGGKLRNRLTGKVSMYKQAKVDMATTTDELKARLDEAKVEAENTVLTEDEQHYTFKDNDEVRLTRATNFLEQLKHEFHRDQAIRAVVASKKKIYSQFLTEDQVRKNWEDKREGGTGIHLLPELYILQRNEGKTREEARKYTMDNLYQNSEAGYTNEEGIMQFSGMNAEIVDAYLDNLLDFIDGLYDKGYELYPEFKIADVEIGVAGTIDLLAVKDGVAHIYDFKTKEEILEHGESYTKFTEFNKEAKFISNGVNTRGFKDYMQDVAPTKANEYSLQLSLYKLILEKKGIPVGDLRIVPLVGELKIDENGDNQYHNLRIFKPEDGVVMSNYNNGTFLLGDLSEKLRNGIEGKTNLEGQIDRINFAEEIAKEAEAVKAADTEVRRWLEGVKLDIQKSQRRVYETADRKLAEDYKGKTEDLIGKISSVDETEALSSYAVYVNKEVARMERKLFGGEMKDAKGNFSHVSEGYANLKWREIREMEKENPEEYMKFIGWLINADAFLNQMVKIGELSYTTLGEAGPVSDPIIKSLKRNEDKVSNMRKHVANINKELDIRYLTLSKNPLFKGKKISDVMHDFFKAQVDESFFQKNLDAMADTHHIYIANVVKMYQITMHNSEREAAKMQKDFEEYSKDVDINKFVRDGKLIREIDYEKFHRMRKEAKEEGNKIEDKFERIDFHKKWNRNNKTKVTPEERSAIIKRKKRRLSTTDFSKWYEAQIKRTSNGGWFDKPSGEFYKPKMEVYADKDYARLTKEEIVVLTKLGADLNYLADHVKGRNIIEEGYIPSVPLSKKGIAETFMSNIGVHGGHQREFDNFDESGNMLYALPFAFNKLQGQEDLPPYDETATGDAKRQMIKERDAARERNRKANAAATLQDLRKVMPMFIETSIKHKHKKKIEFELLRVRKSLIDNHKIKQTKNGKILKDRDKDKFSHEDKSVTKSSKDSNLFKHYNDWLDMVFYENTESNESYADLARVLQNYTSLKSMALNPLSAVNNVTYGELMSRIESRASQYFGTKNWTEGRKRYYKGMPNLFAENDSKEALFMKQFNIMMDYKEMGAAGNINETRSHRTLKNLGRIVNASFFMEGAGEHYLQNRLLFAMADSHRIVNGEIQSFEQFLEGKLEAVDRWGDITVAKAAIERNKKAKKAAKEAFKQYTTVFDAHKVVDGRMVISDDVHINENEIAMFENRVLGVNQYIHGIYNQDDAGTIQKYALGRLAMQFKKWLRPGWNKRWGTKTGTAFFNERRQAVDEGYYTTTAKFVWNPVSRAKNEKEAKEAEGEMIGTMKLFGMIMENYGQFLRNARVHWNSLEEWEKANVRRTMLEYAYLTTAVALGYLLKSIKGEDEEPSQALALLLYQTDRTVTELTTYVPIGATAGFAGGGFLNEFKKILKSPAATFTSFENLFKLSKEMIMYPFVSEEDSVYKGGVYSGQNRVGVQAIKNVPFINQYYKWNNLYKQYSFYKLF